MYLELENAAVIYTVRHLLCRLRQTILSPKKFGNQLKVVSYVSLAFLHNVELNLLANCKILCLKEIPSKVI